MDCSLCSHRRFWIETDATDPEATHLNHGAYGGIPRVVADAQDALLGLW